MSKTEDDSSESNRKKSADSYEDNDIEKERDSVVSKDRVSTMSDAEFQRAVRKVKAQAQIDAILDGPDAPFDLSTELKKVLSSGGIDMSAEGPDGKPVTLRDSTPTLTPEEYAIEEMVHDVESSMYKAASDGDFDEAQSKKRELNLMHMDDSAFVLEANWRFYKSFSEKDYEAMEELWLHDASALCIHPSHAPLLGAKDVLKSFSQMFASGNTNFQRNKMEPTNIRLSVKGTTAIVTCDEEVYTKRFVRGRKRDKRNDDTEKKTKNGMELVNKLIATNIFRKVAGKWKLVYHHSAWHADSEAAKNALNAQISPSLPTTGSSEIQSVPNNIEDITAEGILGIPGHEGLSQRSSSVPGAGAPNGENPIVKRTVFTGSLSDFLNGGLGDILGNSKDQGSGSIDSPSEIHFGSMNDDDDDDEGEDEDGETIIISRNGNAVIPNDDVQASSRNGPMKKAESREKLRQECIKSLRNLAAKGAISQKQKRMLLTDVIMCSAKGESSMVEVAYDLLCDEPLIDDKDGLEEDFADQCRVFASTLPDFPPPKTFSEF